VYDNKIKPMIKWTGGKSQELDIIKKYMPDNFNNYYEPFVGGGAVWFAINPTKHGLYVNDYSEELINFYNLVKSADKEFKLYIEQFSFVWNGFKKYVEKNKELWINVYKNYQANLINLEDISNLVENTMNKNKQLLTLYSEETLFKNQFKKQIVDKIKRMLKNNLKYGLLNDEDIIKNIETGFKTAIYMGCRDLYNKNRFGENISYSTALYFIMRNYAYSGMFRYNKSGGFNVPYGGISYNTKNLVHKMLEYETPKLTKHLNNTNIYQGDFEDFLTKKSIPKKDDFIFLDPPYDSEFSAYEGNKFEAKEQKRLANYLINNCKCKWMMIIKYTDFIYELYNEKNKDINITFFDKKYTVSFMDRNEQEVQHIIIKNY